mmetsp:Transcript_7621/g.19378  ORF Transcript_7621/g.19378 Transcript_7621/m.19378 type:complete len:216 (-) Transcript_7621:553-1200(-)
MEPRGQLGLRRSGSGGGAELSLMPVLRRLPPRCELQGQAAGSHHELHRGCFFALQPPQKSPVSQLVPRGRRDALLLPAAEPLRRGALLQQHRALRAHHVGRVPRHRASRAQQPLPHRERARAGHPVQRPLAPREHALRFPLRAGEPPEEQRLRRPGHAALQRGETGLHRGHFAHRQHPPLPDDQGVADVVRDERGRLRLVPPTSTVHRRADRLPP